MRSSLLNNNPSFLPERRFSIDILKKSVKQSRQSKQNNIKYKGLLLQ